MNDLASWIGVSLIAGTGWLTGHLIGEATQVEQVGMRLVDLRYDRGKVTQQHEVFGEAAIRAEWAASVYRAREVLCSGGSTAVYDGSAAKTMPVDVWVGEKCPDLKPGDRLIAAWEWLGSDNVRYRITGEIVLTPQDVVGEPPQDTTSHGVEPSWTAFWTAHFVKPGG